MLFAEGFYRLPAVADEFLRVFRARRLCYYTHDWFRPGGPDMHPAIGPGESQTVLGIRLGVGEGPR